MSAALPYDRLWGPTYGSVAINISTGTATQLVNATANRSIWVLSYVLVCADANSLWLAGNRGSDTLPTGKDLYMDNSGAAQVGGHLVYAIV